MANRRSPVYEEPNDLELRVRIRKWVQYFFSLREPKGILRKDYAEELGLEPPTVSNLLNDVEWPGLDTFAALHYRLGGDPREMLREDPPPYTLSSHPRRIRALQEAQQDAGQTKVRTRK